MSKSYNCSSGALRWWAKIRLNSIHKSGKDLKEQPKHKRSRHQKTFSTTSWPMFLMKNRAVREEDFLEEGLILRSTVNKH